jgi:two-component system chemotaxis sensor kinase CheA
LETTASSVPHETADSQAASALETVRISVESLDRLMLSSSAMSAENQRVARLTRQLKALQFDVNELNRECESFRRAASASVHRLSMTPEFARIAQYLELIDRSSSALVKKTRQLMAEQRRVAWRLRAGSGQVQRDVHSARLVPAHSVFQGFRKMVRDLAKSQGKEIEFQTIGMNVRADRMVLQELKDPIMHLLRNCVSHGVESPAQRRAAGKPEIGCVSLSLEISGGRLVISIDDDGPGIDELAVRRQAVRSGLLSESAAENLSSAQTLSLVFAPGFSTADAVTELAGRGMGLSIVYDSATRLQGQISLSNRSQSGVRATLSAPVFVSTHRVLLVACGQQTFAIPTHGIERLLRVRRDKTETMEGRPVVTHERRPIRLVRLIDVLGLPNASDEDDQREVAPVVVLKSGDRFLAASVDSLVEERDALILNLDEFSESRLLAGGVLLDDASVALVVQPAALIDNARRDRAFHMPPSAAQIKPIEATKVLIVDDSFTTRTLEKNILESHGFEVGVAMDGVEALSLLREQKFALVISDVEMPRMDGFSLLEEIKSDRRLAGTPVILVTSRDRPEDRRRGLYLGADAYIVKRKFDHQELLGTIRQLT